jgi:hypothetical protein
MKSRPLSRLGAKAARQTGANPLQCLQPETAAELDTLLPAILGRAFKGEL